MSVVLVSGAIANKHRNGGETWVRLSWVLGLQRLGCDVFFVEQIDPGTCVDGEGRPSSFRESDNRAYFEAVMERFGLRDRSALLYDGGRESSGIDLERLLEVADSAALLVNISGHLTLEPVTRRVGRKAYIDLDPGFTQIWHASAEAGFTLGEHDLHFTVGENIGRPGCSIPTGGMDWIGMPPPVVLSQWPVAAADDRERFTTIGSWRAGHGTLEHEGRTLGLKVHEFRKVIELPEQAPGSFELALDIHPGDAADSEALRSHGWRLVDPGMVAADPDGFRAYVSGSGAEFSVATGVYVSTGSGWFSDRTVRYLAAGKPALVQDTGFTSNHPTGEGLVAFTNLGEAVAGAKRILSDYESHCRAARAVAEEHFDSDRVLRRFLDRVEVTP
jgi:hypothetical protein